METTFSVRTQQIIGSAKSLRGGLCRVLDITPDGQENFESRGRMFVLIELYDPTLSCDLELTASLVANALQESYFNLLDGTPITALEKALLDVKQKLAVLQQDATTTSLYLGLSVVVIWGKVVYISQLGNNSITLLRQGEQRVIGEKAGADVNVFSGILEEGDVLICATDNFVKRFPYDFIFKNSARIEQEVASFDDAPRLGCLIVSVSNKNILSKSSLVNIITPKRSSIAKVSKKKVFAMVAVVLALSLTGILFSKGVFTGRDSGYKAKKVETVVPISQVEVQQEQPTALVDFKKKLAKEVNLASFVVLGKNISAVSLTGNAGFVANLDTGEIVEPVVASPNKIWGLGYLEGKYYVLTENGVYSGGDLSTLVLQKVTGSLPADIASFAIYNGNIYILAPAENQIYKLSATTDGYALNPWVTGSVALAGAKSIAVDYFVYILERDGEVTQLLKGEKTSWVLTGIPEELKSATGLFTSSETKFLYLLYSNGIVAQFSKEGAFVKSFKSKISLEKSGVRGLFVEDSESPLPAIYLLISSSVIKLEE